MGINLTLVGQMITFAVFVWFMMKFVWPPLTQAMQERQQRIADGLAAAEQGSAQLQEAKGEAEKVLREARNQASDILAQANRRSGEIIDQAREEAKAEGQRMIDNAHAEIEREAAQLRESLRREVGQLAVQGAQRILKREIDPQAHKALLAELITQV